MIAHWVITVSKSTPVIYKASPATNYLLRDYIVFSHRLPPDCHGVMRDLPIDGFTPACNRRQDYSMKEAIDPGMFRYISLLRVVTVTLGDKFFLLPSFGEGADSGQMYYYVSSPIQFERSS